MNRPCSVWNISSDLFYIDQRVFLHSRVGIAIVFTSDGISVSHSSPLSPLWTLTCLFNVDIDKRKRQSAISWPKLSKEKIVPRVSTKKVTTPSLWCAFCGPPFSPEWPVEPVLTYDINNMNILILWLRRPFVAHLHIARVCKFRGFKISRTAAQNRLAFDVVWRWYWTIFITYQNVRKRLIFYVIKCLGSHLIYFLNYLQAGHFFRLW
jgi:hypothetical protein